MYYQDKEHFKEDLYWLCNECTLEHFTQFRLSSHEYHQFLNKGVDVFDNSLLHFYDELLSQFQLKQSSWDETIDKKMLPTLAMIPNNGLKIIIDYESDGSFKAMTSNGIETFSTFPIGTQFKILKFKPAKKVVKTSKEMFKTVALKQKKYLFYAIAASLSVNILALGSSFYTMQVYDRVIPTNGLSTLIALTIGIAIALFLEMILKLSRSAIMDQASKNMDISYSHDVFERFLNVRSDALPKSIGTLSGQLQSYASVRAFISQAVMFLFIDFPFSFFFLFIILLLGGWPIGLIMVIFLAIALSIGMMFKSKIEKLTKESSLASHKKLGLLVESVENSEKIKAFGGKWSIMNKWGQLTEDAVDDELKIKHYTDISNYLATFAQQISYIAIIATGAYLISTTDEITMGSLIAISILSNKLFSPIAQLPSLFVQWGRAKISIEDLDNIYKLDKENEGVEKPLTHQLSSCNVRVERVKFFYEENEPILNIPKLHIKQGEKVAILGVIGAGKSTLLKVLSGLYKPNEGKVFLDDIDIHQISKNRISETIGYLAQDTKLLAGTLRDNLCFGLVGATDKEILDAARITGLINLISALPKGLDTPVPEGGENVSGGQKQLIALTRIVLANSDMWLLDEPTASMDESTEKRLISVLKNKISAEQTLVVVTHKPVLLNLVDRIIVLTPQGIAMDGAKEEVLKVLADNSMKRKIEN